MTSGPMLTAVGLVGVVMGMTFLAVAVGQYLAGAPFGVACALTIFNFIAGFKVLRAARRQD
jgi:xanthosine utilization system XapX-like protein